MGEDYAPWSLVRDGILALVDTIDKGMEEKPPPPPPDGDFEVFEIIDHRNMPDLAALGMKPLKIWYEGALFDNRTTMDVNLGKVAAAAQQAPRDSVVDIERWADKHTWRVTPENVDRYIEAMQVYQANLGNGYLTGLYSILPVRNYWDAVSNPNSQDYKTWQKWNNEVEPIVAHVDRLMPSLYTFYDKNDPNKFPRQGWVTYARANIEEARRIGAGKKVYAVLWPRYHPGNAGEIPGDYWQLQLDTCEKYADGVVIWDDRTSDKTDWDDLGDWWDVTEAWLKTL